MITSISVVNVLGQEVIRATPSATNYSLDMSVLNAGVYVANVTTAQGEKTIKLIKK
ncbi:MAG: T9SS type A sorting domain-containing protein [Patiriisocius sp.]|uniref:T9SS type A sorting domain-containing protein n=1 Tax=Patiriisocius sp. TaxID=2822396 RepID=UPI003EF9C03E